jgi:hypothetical protein
MYKLIEIQVGQEIRKTLINLANNTCIPFDEANTDYQAYLKWLAEGNTPLPAENT